VPVRVEPDETTVRRDPPGHRVHRPAALISRGAGAPRPSGRGSPSPHLRRSRRSRSRAR
jgi:hypothetical protein